MGRLLGLSLLTAHDAGSGSERTTEGGDRQAEEATEQGTGDRAQRLSTGCDDCSACHAGARTVGS